MFATDIERLEQLVTGRDVPLFDIDIERARSAIAAVIDGKRILVVGGGGSIGSITTKILFEFKPAAVHVVDQSENYLAELVREIRSQPRRVRGVDFRTFPLDYGSPIMQRLLADMEHYDFVLNFAAIKHVRSEKDVYSLLQMIDTNLVKHARLKRWLKAFGHADAYFAVSTDKAANPTSLMGASKRLMEDLIFDVDPIEGPARNLGPVRQRCLFERQPAPKLGAAPHPPSATCRATRDPALLRITPRGGSAMHTRGFPSTACPCSFSPA